MPIRAAIFLKFSYPSIIPHIPDTEFCIGAGVISVSALKEEKAPFQNLLLLVTQGALLYNAFDGALYGGCYYVDRCPAGQAVSDLRLFIDVS